MGRYYFHLHECGTITLDSEGQEFGDLGAVREAAAKLARGIMAGELEAGRLCLLCRLEVHDDAGKHVMTYLFRDAVEITGL